MLCSNLDNFKNDVNFTKRKFFFHNISFSILKYQIDKFIRTIVKSVHLIEGREKVLLCYSREFLLGFIPVLNEISIFVVCKQFFSFRLTTGILRNNFDLK